MALLGVGLAASGARGAEPAPRDRARQLSWDGAYDESLTLYRGLLAAAPSDTELRREYANVLLWAGRLPEGIRELHRVLYADPADDEARLSVGRALYWLGRSREALPYYRFVLRSRADDPAVVAEAVAVFRAAGQADLADAWLRRGLAAHPDDPDLAVAALAPDIEAGDLDRAEAELLGILAEHPEHAGAKERLASVRAERERPVELAKRVGYAGDYPRARGLLREHLERHPDDLEATHALARFAAWHADYPLSQRLYRRLLEARPGDRELTTELGEATSWRGQYAEAREILEPLVQTDRSDLRARLAIANIHLWSGVHRDADRELRGILADAPGYEPAQIQLRALDQLRSPALEPTLSWFQDSEEFTLMTPETRVSWQPVPGRTVTLSLDAPRARGEVVEFDAQTGAATRREETANGLGFRVGFAERPDRAYDYGAELGAATWDAGGAAPRIALFASWYPTYRHMLRAELRHQDALPEVLSIRSGLAGIERSTLYLVHNYQGERFSSWTRLEAGHYSDDPNFWAARTVLGYAILERPIEIDLLGIASAGDFDEFSPDYYSPQDLTTLAAGIRIKKNIKGRADLVLIAEKGKIRSDGVLGDTLRLAPELVWKPTPRLELSLRWDHYESVRRGSFYESDLYALWLRYRFPVRP
jgi:predicted Zn-dependent protease